MLTGETEHRRLEVLLVPTEVYEGYAAVAVVHHLRPSLEVRPRRRYNLWSSSARSPFLSARSKLAVLCRYTTVHTPPLSYQSSGKVGRVRTESHFGGGLEAGGGQEKHAAKYSKRTQNERDCFLSGV